MPGETIGAANVRDDAACQRPVVVAWRDYWLAPSETFIRDQVRALTRWRAICVGRRQYANRLMTPDFAPHSDAIMARIASRLPPSVKVRRRYREIVDDPTVKLVHAHFGLDGLTALPYASRAGKPLVVSFYGMDVTSLPHRRGLDARRFRSGLPRLFDQANALIVPSEFLAHELEALGAPMNKVRINPTGTVVGPPPAATNRSGVVFVGRLVPKKGVADLLRAMALLPEPLRSTRVSIVGYGPLQRSLQRAAAERSLNVTFLGRLPSNRVTELLTEHAVFCGPSQRAPDGDCESLGMVFIEAALAGLPVVSYRHGGVPESVEHSVTGLLAPEGDVAQLSRHLQEMLTDPPRATAMGHAGYVRAAKLFELSMRISRLEDIYDDVINRRRSNSSSERRRPGEDPISGHSFWTE